MELRTVDSIIADNLDTHTLFDHCRRQPKRVVPVLSAGEAKQRQFELATTLRFCRLGDRLHLYQLL